MTHRQIIAAWIFSILWAITLFLWYVSDEYGWGFAQFAQATIFWTVFAGLAHISLGSRKSPSSSRAPVDGKAVSEAERKFLKFFEDNRHQEALQFVIELRQKNQLSEEQAREWSQLCVQGYATTLYAAGAEALKKEKYDEAVKHLELVRELIFKYPDFFHFREETLNSMLQEWSSKLKDKSSVTATELRELQRELLENAKATLQDEQVSTVEILLQAVFAPVILNGVKQGRREAKIASLKTALQDNEEYRHYLLPACEAVSKNSVKISEFMHQLDETHGNENKEISSRSIEEQFPRQNALLQQFHEFLEKSHKYWQELRPPKPLLTVHHQYVEALCGYDDYVREFFGNLLAAVEASQGEGRWRVEILKKKLAMAKKRAMELEERAKQVIQKEPDVIANLLVKAEEDDFDANSRSYHFAKNQGFNENTWPFYRRLAKEITRIAEDASNYAFDSIGSSNVNSKDMQEARFMTLLTFTYVAETSEASSKDEQGIFEPIHNAVAVLLTQDGKTESVHVLSKLFEEFKPKWAKLPQISPDFNKDDGFDTPLGKGVLGVVGKLSDAPESSRLIDVLDYWYARAKEIVSARNRLLNEFGQEVG